VVIIVSLSTTKVPQRVTCHLFLGNEGQIRVLANGGITMSTLNVKLRSLDLDGNLPAARIESRQLHANALDRLHFIRAGQADRRHQSVEGDALLQGVMNFPAVGGISSIHRR
jgi:hypothetical protein